MAVSTIVGIKMGDQQVSTGTQVKTTNVKTPQKGKATKKADHVFDMRLENKCSSNDQCLEKKSKGGYACALPVV